DGKLRIGNFLEVGFWNLGFRLCLYELAPPHYRRRTADAHGAEGLSRRTPLHAAADFNRLEIVKLLLAHQANPNESASDATPLGLAVRNRNAEMVKALIAAGADVNAKGVPLDGGNILVPLAYAARV